MPLPAAIRLSGMDVKDVEETENIITKANIIVPPLNMTVSENCENAEKNMTDNGFNNLVPEKIDTIKQNSMTDSGYCESLVTDARSITPVFTSEYTIFFKYDSTSKGKSAEWSEPLLSIETEENIQPTLNEEEPQRTLNNGETPLINVEENAQPVLIEEQELKVQLNEEKDVPQLLDTDQDTNEAEKEVEVILEDSKDRQQFAAALYYLDVIDRLEQKFEFREKSLCPTGYIYSSLNPKIMYQNRDILDLASNIQLSTSFWSFQPAALKPEVEPFFENRSQFSRMSGEGTPFHSINKCQMANCGFQEPIYFQ